MKKIIFGLFFFLISISAFSQKEPPNPILFITDASGSMSQKIGEETKIAIAKDVLEDLITEMQDNQPTGLVAYGHRNKESCNDIEELVSFDNLDKTFFYKKLKTLNPVGKTPLAFAVQSVIDQLKSKNASATIILITDGLETCEGDLCAVVKEAKAAGIEFVLHIIGFDLKEENKSQLKCAAKEGKGIYVDAADRKQLSEALNQTSDLIVKEPKGRLVAKVIQEGKLIDATVQIFKAGTNRFIKSARSYKKKKTNPVTLKIPLGTYDVVTTLVGKQGVFPINKNNIIVTKKNQEILFDFSAGRLEVSVTDVGQPHDATVKVYSEATGIRMEVGRTYTKSTTNPMKKELSPGVYDFVVKSVQIRGDSIEHTFENVSIKAGETAFLNHNFNSAKLKVGAKQKGKWINVVLKVMSIASGKEAVGGRTYSNHTEQSFLLCAGKYKIIANGFWLEGKPTKTIEVELKAGDAQERIIEF